MNKFSDLNYKDVVFKSCEAHAEIRFAGEVCPVCEAALKIQVLRDKIEELQFDIQEEKDPI